MNEVYYCVNCGQFGPLNEHGRCSTCDSDQVIPAPDQPPTDYKEPLINRSQLVTRKRNEPVMQWASRFVRSYIGL